MVNDPYAGSTISGAAPLNFSPIGLFIATSVRWHAVANDFDTQQLCHSEGVSTTECFSLLPPYIDK
jgi:hypothetical protein